MIYLIPLLIIFLCLFLILYDDGRTKQISEIKKIERDILYFTKRYEDAVEKLKDKNLSVGERDIPEWVVYYHPITIFRLEERLKTLKRYYGFK